MIKLADLTEHPHNPRKISKEQLSKLKESIKGFEKMMRAQPIKIDENNLILAGNQRFKALKALGYKEISPEWVHVIDYMDESEKKEFMVRDNVSMGEFDFDSFEDEFWEDDDLESWVEDYAKKVEFEGAEGVPEEYKYPDSGIVVSHVRMVQLFLNSETEPKFRDMIKSVSDKIGTDNATDTVYKALEIFCKNIDKL